MVNTNTPETSFTVTEEILNATPIEKCSLNPRRGDKSTRLLTGFIIYASEVRKEVADKHPNENFGFISRLVGDQWRTLASDLRFKYHQRALIHNKRIKELTRHNGASTPKEESNIKSTPRLSKRKLAKLARQEQKRLKNAANTSVDSETAFKIGDSSPKPSFGPLETRTEPRVHIRSETKTRDSTTQTPSIRYIDPPPRKALMYSDAFMKRLEVLYAHADETNRIC